MSTNVIITPAVAAAGGAAPPIIPLALAAGAAFLVGRALLKADAEYNALLEEVRANRREQLRTMQLRSIDLDRLVRSAREAKFELSSLPSGSVRLGGKDHEKVWAVREPQGIRLIGDAPAIRRLSIANTTSRALEHLRGRGYEVKAKTKRAGEVQITAKGRGREVIDVVVAGNGEAKVDPKNFAGRKCEGVVRDLAGALEGTVVSFCPKPEYYGSTPVGIREIARG